jgi:hypothetical protein
MKLCNSFLLQPGGGDRFGSGGGDGPVVQAAAGSEVDDDNSVPINPWNSPANFL